MAINKNKFFVTEHEQTEPPTIITLSQLRTWHSKLVAKLVQ
jgi:hypothetical protein